MNDRSLSQLYRRLSAERPALPEAELGRLLCELEPESEALAAAVNALRRPAHPVRARGQRFATHRPAALRWVGSLAACCALAVGAFALHGHRATHWDEVASNSTTAAAPDRIFSSNDRIFASNMPHEKTLHGDELFRSDFSTGG